MTRELPPTDPADDVSVDNSSTKPHPPGATVTVASQDLFRGGREVLIEHSGEVYRLRLTRNGKLILHK